MITLTEAREALGNDAQGLTDAQVSRSLNFVQSLVAQWSETYQKNLFEGKTINELLTATTNQLR